MRRSVSQPVREPADQMELAALPETAPADANRRRGALDTMRLFAIMAVLFDHYVEPVSVHLGSISVRFFLLLSGFLITRTLLRFDGADWATYRTALRSFYGRRALRIWPLYYAILLVLLVTGYISWKWLWVNALFLTNFAQAYMNDWDVPGYLVHVWTLCVQEQFYLFWPALFLALGSRRMVFLIGMITVAVVFRGVMLWDGREDDLAAYVLPFASFDALAIGSLLAVLEGKVQLSRPGLTIAILAVLCAVLNEYGHPYVQFVILPTLLLVPLGILTLLAFDDRLGRVAVLLEWPPLVFLGRISLGIYLLHLPLWLAAHELAPASLMPLVGPSGLTTFAIMAPVTIVVATVSWLVLEKPLQRFRRHLPYPLVRTGQ